MTSLLKQIEKEEEDVGYSKKATLGLPILSMGLPAISASEVINPSANNNQETQLLLPVPSLKT